MFHTYLLVPAHSRLHPRGTKEYQLFHLQLRLQSAATPIIAIEYHSICLLFTELESTSSAY